MRKLTLAYTIGDLRYLNITNRCTLRCSFCPKHCVSPQVPEFDLTLDHHPSVNKLVGAIGNMAFTSKNEFWMSSGRPPT